MDSQQNQNNSNPSTPQPSALLIALMLNIWIPCGSSTWFMSQFSGSSLYVSAFSQLGLFIIMMAIYFLLFNRRIKHSPTPFRNLTRFFCIIIPVQIVGIVLLNLSDSWIVCPAIIILLAAIAIYYLIRQKI